ncbi:nucleotidyltransferase family protein [Clostridium sp. MSJ-4]|uniref:Nucleotidyltransferase family protein n=1 Tax=Clostridium simiarum TaxID=2841506 RepID=A0ABS6EWH6_9CLOT|nr:nucleotidyltransferase family protein [Clostridium simiarum]MBU5590577.1 nucleotidyltransferase family protein [Clostridium simiarum]
MSNLYPFRKVSNNENNLEFKVDFRYSLDDTLDKKAVEDIINSYEENGCAQHEHVLIHLCTHFYDQAKHTYNIYTAKDFNLIKLCDIREYIIHFMDNESLIKMVKFAKNTH